MDARIRNHVHRDDNTTDQRWQTIRHGRCHGPLAKKEKNNVLRLPWNIRETSHGRGWRKKTIKKNYMDADKGG